MTLNADASTPDARIAALEAAVAELQRRVAALESAATAGTGSPYGAVADQGPADQASADDPWSVPPWPEIVHLLHHGKKIHAIKVYREHSGVGLAEAKDVVEQVERRLR